MPDQILANLQGRPLSTGDVARGLMMTREGVRYLIREGQLACLRTPAGWRTIRPDDLLRLAESRTRLRAVGKLPRRRKLGPRGQPRQLAFNSLFRAPLQLVRPRGAKVDTCQVRRADLLQKGVVSDKCAYGSQRAAGGRR